MWAVVLVADVEFKDYSINVKNVLKETAISFLQEAGDEIVSQVARNYDSAGRVKTGQTKGSFDTKVDSVGLEATVGSTYQNAIWEEYGTGIYAESGGRQTPWKYQDKTTGQWYTTRGKTGHRPFFKAWNEKKSQIIEAAKARFSGL